MESPELLYKWYECKVCCYIYKKNVFLKKLLSEVGTTFVTEFAKRI